MQARATEFDLQATGLEPALAVADLSAGASSQPTRAAGAAPAAVLVAIDRAGRLPAAEPRDYDLMLSCAPAAPRPWIRVAPEDFDAEIDALAGAVRRHGSAAAVLAQVLRAAEPLSLDDALAVESFAFSMLLAGPRFRAWQAAQSRRSGASQPPMTSTSNATPTPTPTQAAASFRGAAAQSRVRCTRDGEVLTLHLANPARRNAFDAAMRDALVEALAAAADDPTLAALELRGDGPDFSAGGDLREFGSTPDPVLAHAIRTLRSPAKLLARLGARATAHVHGACVGAGIEVPAAAGRVIAAPDARCWLPELAMGLIPGAGGTATIARRIGRQRLLHWALHGTQIDASTALAWGLVDAIADRGQGDADATRDVGAARELPTPVAGLASKVRQ